MKSQSSIVKSRDFSQSHLDDEQNETDINLKASSERSLFDLNTMHTALQTTQEMNTPNKNNKNSFKNANDRSLMTVQLAL